MIFKVLYVIKVQIKIKSFTYTFHMDNIFKFNLNIN